MSRQRTIEICEICNGEIKSSGYLGENDESWSICNDCGEVEGPTKIIPCEDYEQL